MSKGSTCANARHDNGFAAAMVERASILIVDGEAESRSLLMRRLQCPDGLVLLGP
jgi:hypothetical protein